MPTRETFKSTHKSRWNTKWQRYQRTCHMWECVSLSFLSVGSSFASLHDRLPNEWKAAVCRKCGCPCLQPLSLSLTPQTTMRWRLNTRIWRVKTKLGRLRGRQAAVNSLPNEISVSCLHGSASSIKSQFTLTCVQIYFLISPSMSWCQGPSRKAQDARFKVTKYHLYHNITKKSHSN